MARIENPPRYLDCIGYSVDWSAIDTLIDNSPAERLSDDIVADVSGPQTGRRFVVGPGAVIPRKHTAN